MFEWTYSGLNNSMTKKFGPTCANFLTLKFRLFDTLIVSFFILYLLSRGYKNIKLPRKVTNSKDLTTFKFEFGRKILLILMTFIFGIEIGFKFLTKTFIFILSPCHITTLIQLYLLAAEPNLFSTILFRIQLNLLNGPILSFLYPETELRSSFIEILVFYIQHGLLLIIPIYLSRKGDYYTVDSLFDTSWFIFSYGINLAYHFWILQLVSLSTQVNINYVLCPSEFDPFKGQYYRFFAVIHQGIMCPFLYKLFSLFFGKKSIE